MSMKLDRCCVIFLAFVRCAKAMDINILCALFLLCSATSLCICNLHQHVVLSATVFAYLFMLIVVFVFPVFCFCSCANVPPASIEEGWLRHQTSVLFGLRCYDWGPSTNEPWLGDLLGFMFSLSGVSCFPILFLMHLLFLMLCIFLFRVSCFPSWGFMFSLLAFRRRSPEDNTPHI